MNTGRRLKRLSWQRITWRARRAVRKLKAAAQGRGDLKVWRRCRAILDFMAGMGVSAIARAVSAARSSVYGWLDLYALLGVDGLRTVTAPGSASRLTAYQQQEIHRTVKEKTPADLGYRTAIWTAPLVGDLIYRRFGVKYHNHYIPRLLRKLGLSRQKPRKKAKKADPVLQARWQRYRLPAIKRAAARCGGAVLFQDEASFWVDGTLHITWGAVGEQPVVETYGKRDTAHVFGAVALEDGAFSYRFEEAFNGKTFGNFLKQLVRRYAPRKVFLIIDNAPWHWLPPDDRVWLRQNADKIRLFRLPANSPELNPTEKVWKETRKRVTHNRFHPTAADRDSALREAFSQFQHNRKLLDVHVAPWR